MITKVREKSLALKLRRQGLSYTEILERVPVSKSTLSVWFQGIGIAQHQKQRFTLRRKLAQKKARETCRLIRINRESEIIKAAQKEIQNISLRELWIIGTVLYWAEGSKQKEHNVSQKVSFNNSDPKMILLFNKWIQEICLREASELTYSIYIHQTADKEKTRQFWEKLLNTKIEKMYFKCHKPKTNRKNTSASYYGLLRIDVKKSTDLNRKIKGWIQGINDSLKI